MSDNDDWNLGFLAALEALPGSAARRLSAIGLSVPAKSAAWCQGFNYGHKLVAVRLSRSEGKRVPVARQARYPTLLTPAAHQYPALQNHMGSSRLH